MPESDFATQRSQFSRTLRECRDLYISSGRLCALEYPHLISKSGDAFIQMMDDLHRGLALKVYFTICESDRRWSQHERLMAKELVYHLWEQRADGDNLKAIAKRASEQVQRLKWYSLVRPFDRIAPLRDRVAELETIVLRLANLVARADGSLHPQEAAAIGTIQAELEHHLRSIPIDQPDQHEAASTEGTLAIETLRREADDVSSATRPATTAQPRATAQQRESRLQTQSAVQPHPDATPSSQFNLADALAELDGLIGLDRVKHEVRTLTNFLKLQRQRKDAGLPVTDLSLHMVFNGNPGTGKTTVARIVGKIYGAMGILAKGHVVETDRSGLVAEYAGQTGPRTNAKIDEALDGLLFIDEAYSLIAPEGDDPFGREAVQTLLKRAEDDRRRLVIILAGYPREMDALLQTNPGLSSRFNRQLTFDDYGPPEMARIFGRMCDKNHYQLTSQARIKILLGLDAWYRHRDRHFGNGRAVRNLFEHTIRRLANRLADLPELSRDQLSLFEEDDIEFSKVPGDAFQALGAPTLRICISCPECRHGDDVPQEFLGRHVSCPKCKTKFVADWGELQRGTTRKGDKN